MTKINVENIKKDFPILDQRVNDNNLVYLDSAATTHKPKSVLDEVREYNEKHNGNPHRGAHSLSVISTEKYEDARERVRKFINAKSSKEIIFTKNTTESLNLITYSYGMDFINSGDEIVLSIMEHHSNIVPWQRVAKAKNANIKYMYLNEDEKLTMDEVKEKITKDTKIVGITHMSNVLGTINPIKDIIDYAHDMGAIVVVDGAQSTPHMKVDVTSLDADFFVFSGHKILGPMGIGVLYGKEELLETMSPFLSGGNMIEYVLENESTFAPIPHKFEGGSQNVEGAVGLAKAIEYIENIGIESIRNHEIELTRHALEKMMEIPYIKIHGPKDVDNRGGVISFSVDDVHPHDVASILDAYGVEVRSGHHCAQPLMKYLDIPGTTRISFYLYNDKQDVDIFIESLKKVRKWLGYGS
ncbi:cysteine desulfurase [Dethiothermospora halolimnae]|uniref:cysteine desulfurase n=1 Tax=Dethiothermospora halolimnae TaxID=3114390 RepID=UPI003CCC1121